MGRVENGEKAQQMRGPVNGNPLLRNEGMGMVAALHIQAAFLLGVHRHAGQQTGKADGVGIAQKGRNGRYLAHVHLSAHAPAVHHYGLFQLLGNHGLVQGQLRHGVGNLRRRKGACKQKQKKQYLIP